MQHNSTINFTKQCTTGQTSSSVFQQLCKPLYNNNVYNIHRILTNRCSVFLVCIGTFFKTYSELCVHTISGIWTFGYSKIILVILFSVILKFIISFSKRTCIKISEMKCLIMRINDFVNTDGNINIWPWWCAAAITLLLYYTLHRHECTQHVLYQQYQLYKKYNIKLVLTWTRWRSSPLAWPHWSSPRSWRFHL